MYKIREKVVLQSGRNGLRQKMSTWKDFQEKELTLFKKGRAWLMANSSSVSTESHNYGKLIS